MEESHALPWNVRPWDPIRHSPWWQVASEGSDNTTPLALWLLDLLPPPLAQPQQQQAALWPMAAWPTFSSTGPTTAPGPVDLASKEPHGLDLAQDIQEVCHSCSIGYFHKIYYSCALVLFRLVPLRAPRFSLIVLSQNGYKINFCDVSSPEHMLRFLFFLSEMLRVPASWRIKCTELQEMRVFQFARSLILISHHADGSSSWFILV